MINQSRKKLILLGLTVLFVPMFMQGCSTVNTSGARSATHGAKASAAESIQRLKEVNADAASALEAGQDAFNQGLDDVNSQVGSLMDGIDSSGNDLQQVIVAKKADLEKKMKARGQVKVATFAKQVEDEEF
jgi:hypothetical protein